MIKLLHAADLHLDAPFSGLAPEKGAVRRAELREIPARLAELARSEGVRLALLPGDLFDGERVRPESVRALADALEDMAVPVFIAPGNHDFLHAGSPYETARWPGNVHIFTDPALEGIEVPELDCVVHGCAFTAPHREDDPLSGFTAPDDGGTHLLCLHGEIARSGVYAPISPDSIARSGAAYAALGHVHAAGGGREGGVSWAYPGCPEGRGFDECGPKGVLLVTIDGERTDTQFVQTCRRQYRVQPLELTDGEAPEDFPGGDTPDLVRLLLRGERARPLDLPRLARRWEGRCFHLELRDETALPQDLWARAEEDSLTGLFLRGMKERLDQASDGDRAGLLLAARFGLAALEGEEDIRP